MIAALPALVLLAQLVEPLELEPRPAPAPPEIVPGLAPPTEIVPRTLTVQRADSILLDSVVHEDGWWVQPALMASIYDPRRDVVIARWSAGLNVGRRFSRWGLLAQVEFDETLDFTLDTQFLNVLNVGVGGEYLSFLGHVRSSLTVGATVLLTDTAIDERGEIGWYIDLRPGGLRWSMGERLTFEFVPISLDVLVVVPSGIPLVLYSYGTLIGVEWSTQ